MMEWLLETALLVLLAATLFHAMRLERALGVLKRDRAALEELVAGFNSSTRAAEQGIERLRAAAEGAGRQVQRQVDVAAGLKDDLLFLTERGERLADRLDAAGARGPAAGARTRRPSRRRARRRTLARRTPARRATAPDDRSARACAARPSATCCGRCARHADMRLVLPVPAPAAADHRGHGGAAGGQVGGAGARRGAGRGRRRPPPPARAGRRRPARPARPEAPTAAAGTPRPGRAIRPPRTAPPRRPPPSRRAPAEPPVSDSERALLLDLRGRRAELEAQAAALAAREAALAAAEQRLAARVGELGDAAARLEALEADRQAHDEANWRGLVKLYETMKPRDAAAIFNDLDLPVLLPVLDRMKESKAAPVLAAMQPERARQVTAELAQLRTRANTPARPASTEEKR